MPDWFRRTDWNEEIEAEFFRRLKRARQYNSSQYLVIQAGIPGRMGRPELAAVALNLIELFFQEHYDAILAGQAFTVRGEALLILGRWDEACQAFEDACGTADEAHHPRRHLAEVSPGHRPSSRT